MASIPVSVIILTKNEERRIAQTIACLDGVDDIWVVDSQSDDDTAALAKGAGAQTVNFSWNGQYPKKKQWALNNLALRHDWVLMLDADERVTPALNAEIRALFSAAAPDVSGYFVKGLYRVGDQILRFGQINKKLMLFNRHDFVFPDVGDEGFVGGWEVEGHYQPILCDQSQGAELATLKAHLIHDAFDDIAALDKRHQNYASWEALMCLHGRWPQDPVPWRQRLKKLFRALPLRWGIVFVYSYIVKGGICDGRAGLAFARQRALYYKDIARYKRRYKAEAK
jgi:glycosyltransferase involved in cell wall biosynthesis